MTEFTQTLLISNLYRVLCLMTGFGIAFLGFRLFKIGITAQPSGAEGNVGAFRFAFKNLAPGSFFAVCGVFIALAGALRPVTVTRGTDNSIGVTYPPAGKTNLALLTVATPLPKNGQGGPAFTVAQGPATDTLLKKLKNGESLTETERQQIALLLADKERITSSSFSSSSPPCDITSVTMGYEVNQNQKKWYEFWK